VKLTSLCADPGIRLDQVKGATIHLTALWRALGLEGAAVTGIAACGNGAPVAPEPGVTVLPIPFDGADLPSRVLAAAFTAVERGAAPDAVLERLALDSDAGLVLARRLRVPLVVEINAPLDEEARRFRGREPTPEMLERQRRLLEGADLVYVVSDALAEYAWARGARRGRVRVLPNGVDTASFVGPRMRREDGAPVRVGFVGAFRPWHGLELLVDACACARAQGAPIELELIGDGPLREPLERRVAARGLAAHVRFLGARPHADVPGFLLGVDVAVVAAPEDVDYYFSPLKLYEYAAAGCAIVAPRAGQVEARFRHGEDALLVPPGNTSALAEGIVALAADAPLRVRLGDAARARARAEFDWRIVARTILDWIPELRAVGAEKR